ncbi:MAG: hypothetical protein M1504_01445 [Candidatus Marsarchaeota archaeon]|nr:hypothetical protein [Candidatus Marsarchaeota archaeon]
MAERLLTLNLRRYLIKQPRTKRSRKAAAYIRERVAHYTKIDEENVKISENLNMLIHRQYVRRMVPIKLLVKIGTDTADVLPYDETMKTRQENDQKGEKKGKIGGIIKNAKNADAKQQKPDEKKPQQQKQSKEASPSKQK